MNYYSQYGEEEIFKEFFKNKVNGFVVDIGAADGITNSNSRFLIENLNWGGILIEPVPAFFKNLLDLYENNNSISLVNSAVFKSTENEVDFFQFNGIKSEDTQCSTLALDFKTHIERLYGEKYSKTTTSTITLIDLFNSLNVTEKFDLLSVDCEGADMEALKSNDWKKYRPELVCIEHSMSMDELSNFMTSIDYKLYTKNDGNVFYENISNK
jgi:FkbM family methyltransferase